MATSAQADTQNWAGVVNNFWSEPGNWNPNGGAPRRPCWPSASGLPAGRSITGCVVAEPAIIGVGPHHRAGGAALALIGCPIGGGAPGNPEKDVLPIGITPGERIMVIDARADDGGPASVDGVFRLSAAPAAEVGHPPGPGFGNPVTPCGSPVPTIRLIPGG